MVIPHVARCWSSTVLHRSWFPHRKRDGHHLHSDAPFYSDLRSCGPILFPVQPPRPSNGMLASHVRFHSHVATLWSGGDLFGKDPVRVGFGRGSRSSEVRQRKGWTSHRISSKNTRVSDTKHRTMAETAAVAPPETSSLPPMASILKSLLAGGIAGGVYVRERMLKHVGRSEMDTRRKRRSPRQEKMVQVATSGGWNGTRYISRTAVAPLERLKILQQVQDATKPQYTGVVQGLIRIWKTEGFRGMMKGNGANCVRIMPNSAVKFLTYEELASFILRKMRETDPDANMTPVLRLCAGAGAGIVAMSATYPLDMVRGRLTVQRSGEGAQYRGILHATGLIVRSEGLRSLYKGWLPSVLGVIPYVGLNFAVYESLKDWLLKRNGLKNDQDLSVATRLTCGAIAGSIGQTVAFPLDVVRRRLQVAGWQGASEITGDAADSLLKSKGTAHYNGMVDCFIKTVREEGFQALFRGLMPNYLKVAPSIAIAFVSYEQCKKSLGVELKIGD